MGRSGCSAAGTEASSFGCPVAELRNRPRISDALIGTSSPGKTKKGALLRSEPTRKKARTSTPPSVRSLSGSRSREPRRQGRVQRLKRLARPGRDDQRRQERNLRRATPAAQPQEAVGAHQAVKRAAGIECRAQAQERIDGVVRGRAAAACGLGRIGKRDRESRLAFDGKARHCQTVVEARYRTLRLERLRAHGGEEHGVEPNAARAARATARWPRCGGSKLPPKNATRKAARKSSAQASAKPSLCGSVMASSYSAAEPPGWLPPQGGRGKPSRPPIV